MIVLTLFLVFCGLVLLFGGGELLTRGAVSLAQALGMSQLLIGLTVVAAATSMPELVVALAAALEGAPDIAIGNVVGSNTANIMLILGIATVICPMAAYPHQVTRDGLAMVGATALFIVVALTGVIGRLEGLGLLVMLGLYLAYSYYNDRSRRRARDEAEVASAASAPCDSLPKCGFLILLGVVLLVIGSKLLVDGALDLAREAGVSEAVIGLTLVAVGTSLPELATGIVASYRRHPEVALGNVLGSNVFNLLAIIGIVTVIKPLQVAPEILSFDLWVMAAVTLLLLGLLYIGRPIGRWHGLCFLLAYGAYMVMLFVRG